MMDLDAVDGVLIPIGQDAPPQSPTLAIYLLAAVLRQHDYDFSIIDLVAEETNKIDRHLSTLEAANLIAISATSLNWATVLSVIRQIRAVEITVPIVVGGVHPTMFPDYILGGLPGKPVDFVIRHEGEKALLLLCKALEGQLDYAEIRNLSWRTADGQIIHNSIGPTLTVEELEHFLS